MSRSAEGGVVVAITGASGSTYGVSMLRRLRELGVETHLIVSEAGARCIRAELGIGPEELRSLATTLHDNADIGAVIASGSVRTQGMIVAPCTIKTLSGVAACRADSLILRAADVTLKEGRPLLLLLRETPLHLGHLKLMVQVAEYGATVFPAVPAFYTRPTTIDELVSRLVDRCLERFGIATATSIPWAGDRATDDADADTARRPASAALERVT